MSPGTGQRGSPCAEGRTPGPSMRDTLGHSHASTSGDIPTSVSVTASHSGRPERLAWIVTSPSRDLRAIASQSKLVRRRSPSATARNVDGRSTPRLISFRTGTSSR